MSKLKNQQRHALMRSSERYGLFISKSDLKAIVNKIQNGRATFIKSQSNRVSLFKVQVYDKECTVVYDKVRKTVVTFLPNREIE